MSKRASTLPHDEDTTTGIDPVTTTDHRPGSPLESKEDQKANAELRKEEYPSALPEAPPLDIQASSPSANFAGRNNIVADGPGTVADFLVLDAPELLPATDPRSPDNPVRQAEQSSSD